MHEKRDYMRQNHKIPWLAQFVMKDAWFCKPGDEKCLYLSFDDGPHPEFTPAILELLNKFEAKATFFCLGENVVKYPEVYKSILADGHTVGNHLHHHLSAFKSNRIEYLASAKEASLHIDSKLLRPPYGSISPYLYRKLKKEYQLVFWDVMPGDFVDGITSDKLIENSINNIKPGSIVVFHDRFIAQPNLLPALESILSYYSNLGFKFCAISK